MRSPDRRSLGWIEVGYEHRRRFAGFRRAAPLRGRLVKGNEPATREGAAAAKGFASANQATIPCETMKAAEIRSRAAARKAGAGASHFLAVFVVRPVP